MINFEAELDRLAADLAVLDVACGAGTRVNTRHVALAAIRVLDQVKLHVGWGAAHPQISWRRLRARDRTAHQCSADRLVSRRPWVVACHEWVVFGCLCTPRDGTASQASGECRVGSLGDLPAEFRT
jgi:hypothetical protein